MRLTKVQLLEQADALRYRIRSLETELGTTQEALRSKIDTAMVVSRNEALKSLSTMAEAVGYAVKMVVGKEVL